MGRKIGSINKVVRKDKGVSRKTKILKPAKVKMPKLEPSKPFKAPNIKPVSKKKSRTGYWP